jgi:hypothetical protein
VTEDELRRTVQELRTALPDITESAEERAELEVVLDRALADTGAEPAGELRAALEFNTVTRRWVREHVARPDGVRDIGGAGLPGLGTGITGELFVCPHDDFDFVRESVGQVVPLCPAHDIPLIHENA